MIREAYLWSDARLNPRKTMLVNAADPINPKSPLPRPAQQSQENSAKPVARTH